MTVLTAAPKAVVPPALVVTDRTLTLPVNEVVPVVLTVRSVAVPVTVPVKVTFLMVPAARARAPVPVFSVGALLTVIVVSGRPAVPTVRPAVKSGRAVIVRVSAALPRLKAAAPVGLTKSVWAKVGPVPLRRERVL